VLSGILAAEKLADALAAGRANDQPIHLRVKNPQLQKTSELDIYAGPSTRYCPAGVYEWVEKDGKDVFVINA
jgi:electron-transferring-flavoprotein dehydrogenase